MLHPIRRLTAVNRSLAVGAAALFVALAAVVTPIGPAAAADEVDAPEVRWSVTPADASGPDGRRAVEHELDPGESIEEHFAVRNVGEDEVTFSLTAADGFYTRTGRFDILPADEESIAAGTWIDLPETVTVPGGETVVVPFTLTVPDVAEPGDHAAGITASVLSVQSSDDGTSVGVESRVGFRVLTRVKGEITHAAALTAVVSNYTTSWNPLRPGEVTVTFDVVNEGNTRLLAEGTVEAGGRTATFPAEGENQQELLPGDTRTFTVVVDDVWPLFVVPTAVTLDATALTMTDDSTPLDPVRAEVMTWAMPWPQLIILLGIALLVGAIVWGRVRSRRRLEALLADAREAGRRESEAPADVT
ncbi:hypothetical protein [Microbacterium sp. CFBP9034]|uniref:hypothetical protein n=1 Tax=Microbacterium sp. CFBP9034 TaxID=3096540 RepID=UPI002A69DF52|nr:hypothetical protein [Microbacterium sp. CFBP9034]MDY0908616.1 hypothetical protein [Microbacterium sp. CFBP9034]